MYTSKLSSLKLSQLYDKLVQAAKACSNKEHGKEDEESEIKKIFSLSSPVGKQLYRSLSDEQLLYFITDIAKEIGHSPAQKEVFWVLREYIKLRFKKWPYALTAAGLSKSAGKKGQTLSLINEMNERYKQMIFIIRDKAKVLGRIPHPKDLPEIYIELGEHKHTWQEAIKDAGLDQNFFIINSLYIINDLEEEYLEYLMEVLNRAKLLGRAPMRNEIDIEIKEKLIKRCGTWRNTLYQIGLEPVTRITPFSAASSNNLQNDMKQYHRNTLYDCHYKILNPDLQMQNDLMFIKTLSGKLHHKPHKNEVPEEIRLRLQKSCGSWSNALYQLDYKKVSSKNIYL